MKQWISNTLPRPIVEFSIITTSDFGEWIALIIGISKVCLYVGIHILELGFGLELYEFVAAGMLASSRHDRALLSESALSSSNIYVRLCVCGGSRGRSMRLTGCGRAIVHCHQR